MGDRPCLVLPCFCLGSITSGCFSLLAVLVVRLLLPVFAARPTAAGLQEAALLLPPT
jgi:hypothetical protein